jgi:anaerobic ribonucleoside-triphosphate reductase activating protein
MNYLKHDIVFQEIPDEISLTFYCTGCQLHCKGCHSPELWNSQNGKPLSVELLQNLIRKYQGSISCVLFMGGEWEPQALVEFIQAAKAEKIKTALYTGRELEELPTDLTRQLDYLKTGPWKEELGGLDSPTTNQKFYHFKEATCL